MSGECEQNVGVGEVNPAPGVAFRRELVRGQIAVNDVEVGDEYERGEHGEQVAGGDRDEYETGGRASQFDAREHNDREQVGHKTEAAHDHDEPAVDGPIVIGEANQKRYGARLLVVHHIRCCCCCCCC